MALFTAIVVTLAAGQMFAPTGKQKFEVSTIRGSKPGAQEGAVRPAPGGRRYIGTAVPLRVYLWTASGSAPGRGCDAEPICQLLGFHEHNGNPSIKRLCDPDGSYVARDRIRNAL